MSWSEKTDTQTAYRRAGGRRHYNSVRQLRAAFRQADVLRLRCEGYTQKQVAKILGVCVRTIKYDEDAIEARFNFRPTTFRGVSLRLPLPELSYDELQENAVQILELERSIRDDEENRTGLEERPSPNPQVQERRN